jgi:hypothetical protein
MVSRASSGSDGSHFGSGSLPISTMSGESSTNDPIRHEPTSHRRQMHNTLTMYHSAIAQGNGEIGK